MLTYLWMKIFHIGAMAIWISGLFLLPRLFIAGSRGHGADAERLNEMGKMLYFGVMTPAGIVTMGLGLALISFGFEGIWFPAKMALVSLIVLMHLYYGQLLLDLSHGRLRHGTRFLHVLNWVPLVLVLAIAALTAAKPRTLAGLG